MFCLFYKWMVKLLPFSWQKKYLAEICLRRNTYRNRFLLYKCHKTSEAIFFEDTNELFELKVAQNFMIIFPQTVLHIVFLPTIDTVRQTKFFGDNAKNHHFQEADVRFGKVSEYAERWTFFIRRCITQEFKSESRNSSCFYDNLD